MRIWSAPCLKAGVLRSQSLAREVPASDEQIYSLSALVARAKLSPARNGRRRNLEVFRSSGKLAICAVANGGFESLFVPKRPGMKFGYPNFCLASGLIPRHRVR